MAVAVKPGTDPQFSLPAALFRPPPSSVGMTSRSEQYDVSADGSRFLVLTRPQASAGLHVIVNWQSHL
jgi:hypothetical protein